MRNYIIYISLLISSQLMGQMSSNFNSSKNWSMNKHEIFFAAGPTHFLGDLGGLNKEGTQKSMVDLDFKSTRIGGGIGYRFRFHPRWATSTQLFFALVDGKDSNTDEIIRNSRNLSFRSPILELSQRIEWILLANERVGARSNRRELRGAHTKADILYIFSGISGFYFNPQTQIDGKWTNLRPLRTEGQGLPGGADEYGMFSVAIPFGIGFKTAIGEFWRLGVELTYNKTFTDYIDDVSTVYYSPSILASEVGQDAVKAANPSIENQSWFQEGMQRGNSDDKDAYLFTNIVLTRNITYAKVSHGRRVRYKGRTKF